MAIYQVSEMAAIFMICFRPFRKEVDGSSLFDEIHGFLIRHLQRTTMDSDRSGRGPAWLGTRCRR